MFAFIRTFPWTRCLIAAVCLLALLTPAASAAPSANEDLSGSWRSTTRGPNMLLFTWEPGGRYTVRQRGVVVAHAFIVGRGIAYIDETGITKHPTVTEFYRGKPSAIRFPNGIVFRKMGTPGADAARPGDSPDGSIPMGPIPGPFPNPPPAPPVASHNLTGTWSSNLGLTYRITQEGDTFRWTVDGQAQTGQGTITGERVHASWQGPFIRGASGGTVRVGASGPQRIDFDNGVVMTLR